MANSLQTKSRSLPELDTLKFFAIILITNSHISHLYPNPNMGTGGSLGNSIFFLVSAIGLTLSLDNKKVEFISWFYKRASRTYFITWVATIIFLIIGFYSLEPGLIGIVKMFIFPTGYWFIPAITLFYIPIYFIITNYSFRNFIYISILVSIVYFIAYISFLDMYSWSIESPSFFKWIFYFEVMVVGVYLGKSYQSFTYKGSIDFIILLVLTVFYFGFKLLISKFNSIMPLQFIIQFVTIPWVIYFLKFTRSNAVNEKLSNWKFLNFTVISISLITLEIYLLQTFFYELPIIHALNFPLNILLFAALLLAAAWSLNKLYHYNYGKHFKKKQ